jgi:type IV pilus assembly protein PilB
MPTPTPNDPNLPKKPQGAQPARPAQPGQPGATPPAGTPRPAQPGAPRPAQAPAPKPAQPGQAPAPKPAQPGVTPAAGTPRPAVPQQGGTIRPAQPGAPRPQTPGAAPPGAAKPAPAKPAGAGGQPAAPQKPGVPQQQRPAAPKPATPGAAEKKPEGAQPAKPAAAKAPPPKGPAKPGSSARHEPRPAKAAQSRGGRQLGQVLIDLGFLDEAQLDEILEEAKNSGQQVGQIAVTRGLLNEDQLLQAIADQYGLKLVNLQEAKPSPEALTMVPETMASVYKVMPLAVTEGALTVVLSDPANLPALDDLRNFLGLKEVNAVLASPTLLTEALAKCYAGKEESIMDIIKALEDDPDLASGHREGSIDLESLMEIQDAAPVRKLLNMVMLLAIKDHASDIHFEPFEEEYKMRYRRDGVLYEMIPPPRHLAMAISSRIKVMANLDIAERRLPQDGRIELNVGGNAVDMRVSILPTMFGESVVIRVLDRSNVGLDLNKVGMAQDTLATFREVIHKPNGIALVTGPTGSGKTTTLYSALNELNEITEKIITTEDPVEYDIDGIVQCPINHEIGVTFAAALRSILRQDPDIILVGEIRDLETAQIAVQAALTGHMVFSTLHTNDAPSTITRMRDMGLEPFLITATLEAILAQRLVRKICLDCRSEFEPSQEILMELNLRAEDVKGKKFYYGKGCERCTNTGHKGRTGLHELVLMNDELRDLITAGKSTDELRVACRKMGMTTLREAGMRAINSGVTTIDEVVHETVLEDEV